MMTTAPTPPLHDTLARRAMTLAATLALALTGCVGGSPTSQRAPQPARQLTIAPSANAQQCLINLGHSQANFTPLADQYYGQGCSTINAVRLAWLRGDDAHLQLANLGPVTCPLAAALEGWARFGVDRAARQTLGSPLARIDTFGSYNCRNIAGTDHRSAHATANAIDIAGFVLADGRRITVKGDWNDGPRATRDFLRIVRTSACRRFATVLTPDFNAAHQDHFHLEVGSPHGVCR